MLFFFILLFVLLLKQHLEYVRISVDPSTSADRLHVLLRATCYVSSPLLFDSMCRSSKIMARFYAATPVWTLVGSIGATLTVRFPPTTRFNRLKIKTFFEWATEDDEVDECWCYLGYSYRTGRGRWLAISSNASAWEAKSFHRRLSAFICLMTHGNEHTTKNRRRRRRGGPGWVAISDTKPPNEEKNGNFTTDLSVATSHGASASSFGRIQIRVELAFNADLELTTLNTETTQKVARGWWKEEFK